LPVISAEICLSLGRKVGEHDGDCDGLRYVFAVKIFILQLGEVSANVQRIAKKLS
jgi:hypothetical protein